MLSRNARMLVLIVSASAVAVGSCTADSKPTSAALGDGSGSAGADMDRAGSDARLPAPLPPLPAPRRGAPEPAEEAAKLGAIPTTSSPASSPGAGQAQAAQLPGAMLIRSGHAVIEVDSVQSGIARVRRLAEESGALIANTTIHSGREQRRSASLELRVPSARFDAVVSGLTPIGKVESVNIAAQDVGEEFVDLSARLANARRLEARLIELLANRTGRLTDVLAVERELARIREEIERYEGRLRYLQARVSVSSLTVVVHEPLPVVATHPGQNVIADAFVEAWRRFVLLTAAFIASLGVLVPLAAIALGAYVLWRRHGTPRPPTATAEQA